jgi:hypothetical protein
MTLWFGFPHRTARPKNIEPVWQSIMLVHALTKDSMAIIMIMKLWLFLQMKMYSLENFDVIMVTYGHLFDYYCLPNSMYLVKLDVIWYSNLFGE